MSYPSATDHVITFDMQTQVAKADGDKMKTRKAIV